MQFNFDDLRDKVTLLTRYSQEEIMEIMGIPTGQRRFCSPFRDDRNPTCTLWKAQSGKLYFMDWAMFEQPKDVFEVYMYLYRADFSEAVIGLWDLFEREFTGENPRQTPRIEVDSEELKIDVAFRELVYKDLRWWRSFGVEKDILEKYNVRAVQSVWINERLTYNRVNYDVTPGYAYVFRDGSKKVYFPFKDYNRFLHDNAQIIQGYDQLPDKDSLLVITKSMKDVMLLHSLGVSAIAPQSEGIPISIEIIDELRVRFQNIVVLFDTDRAGIKGLRKYKVLNLPVYTLKRDWKTKDISDFYLKYGVDQTLELVTIFKGSLRGGPNLSSFKIQ
jgi:hypothetical protein